MKIGTNYWTKAAGSNIEFAFHDGSGNSTKVRCATADIPSAATGYAIGCMLVDTTTGELYTNIGTATSCSFAKTNNGDFLTKSITLSATQIKALYTTSVEVIPAVASKAIYMYGMTLDLTGTATQFANGGVVNLQYDSTANGAGTTLHADIAATVVTGATARVLTYRIPKDLSAIATASITGKGVYIGAKTADFITGTGTAVVTVKYTVY
ncbi:MAG: hypothetical protein WCO06_01510 [Candidatus Roizmanbacteria bacterium]